MRKPLQSDMQKVRMRNRDQGRGEGDGEGSSARRYALRLAESGCGDVLEVRGNGKGGVENDQGFP